MYSQTLTLGLSIALAASVYPFSGQPQPGAPETFEASVAAAAPGGPGATITIDVTRYTPDPERVAVETALKTGGFAGFVAALKKAPGVGAVTFDGNAWTIRWAREVKSAAGRRTLTFVTDRPMFFLGSGAVDAKPRKGYEVALIQLDVDGGGRGKGTIVAAARVRPGGETGVQIDDYAERPITFTSVVRQIP